jgi:hypothetical protein
VVFSHLLFRNPNKYAEHVCNHEDFHQKNQAKVMNAPLLRVAEGGSEITFKVQPNLVEGQASAKSNQDNELTPEYRVFKGEYLRAAALVSATELDAAIRSGDIMSLQEALNAKKQERRAA